MFTKKHISRRAVLRGIGATVALPFLEAMAPAMTPTAQNSREPAEAFWGGVCTSGRTARLTGRRRKSAQTSSSRRS